MLTHVDDAGRPRMVDVSAKDETFRTARAVCEVYLPDAVTRHVRDGVLDSKKGPVFHTAIIAGVMAAKRTHELIPFCHPIGLDRCNIRIEMAGPNRAMIECETAVRHRTGVEMEALTGATVAALTVYDMCKGLSHDIRIEQARLLEKRGGKSDYDGDPALADAGAEAS